MAANAGEAKIPIDFSTGDGVSGLPAPAPYLSMACMRDEALRSDAFYKGSSA